MTDLSEVLLRPANPRMAVEVIARLAEVEFPEIGSALEAMDWMRSNGRFRQNRLVSPKTEGGLTLFYVENQSCFRWAYDPDDPARTVYGRQSACDSWSSEDCGLDTFLAQVSVFESIMAQAAPHAAFGAGIPESVVKHVLQGYSRVLESWSWPEKTSFYANGDSLVFLMGERETYDIGLITQDIDDLDVLLPFVEADPEGWPCVIRAGQEI